LALVDNDDDDDDDDGDDDDDDDSKWKEGKYYKTVQAYT